MDIKEIVREKEKKEAGRKETSEVKEPQEKTGQLVKNTQTHTRSQDSTRMEHLLKSKPRQPIRGFYQACPIITMTPSNL